MKKFIVLTFLLLGWGYYEMSGGADFVPEQAPAALAEAPPEALAAPESTGVEIATRADTADVTLASLTEPETAPADVLSAVPAEDIAAAISTALPEPPEAAPVVEVVAPAPQSVTDLRAVTGDNVNLRTGPGREFDVLDQLEQGDVVEVVTTGSDSWVEVVVEATGQSGWMSADFLLEIGG